MQLNRDCVKFKILYTLQLNFRKMVHHVTQNMFYSYVDENLLFKKEKNSSCVSTCKKACIRTKCPAQKYLNIIFFIPEPIYSVKCVDSRRHWRSTIISIAFIKPSLHKQVRKSKKLSPLSFFSVECRTIFRFLNKQRPKYKIWNM